MFESDDKLRGVNENIPLTAHQVQEYMKCKDDPIYFISHYIMIESGWSGIPGLVNFIPEPYQIELIMALHDNRYMIGKLSRQVGKSTAVDAYAVWCIIFRDSYRVLLAAHKEKAAKNNMSTVKGMYRNLPLWLQEGIESWRVETFKLENGSSVMIETTTEDSGRSGSYSLVILDEFAFVDANVAEKFYAASYPTIAANPNSKLAIISTPNGMNLFYKFWQSAIMKKSSFVPVEIKWNDPPNRDDKFKEETIANVGMATWLQEFECIFAGGQNALIRSDVLTNVELKTDFEDDMNGMFTFEEAIPEHIYFISVDVARGREGDNSTFIVFDITELPYRVVCSYANNEISPMAYPNLLHETAMRYNEAYVLVELNDSGQEVADILQSINEYHNVMGTSKEDGVTILGGDDEKLPGITTTGPTKSKGCTTLRALIENKQLYIYDFRMVEELSNFTLQDNGKTYKASPGNKDDLAMALVIFAWATTQQYFSELSDTDIRSKLFSKYEEQLEESMLPVGIPLEINDRYQDLIDSAIETEWMNEPRWYILMQNKETKENFLAGETDLRPNLSKWNYKNFATKEDAEEFSKFLKIFKGYRVLKCINSREAKPFLRSMETV